MKLTDIENLTHDELKARRLELITAAETGDVKELATRFVDARTDAKLRDEKLAEQAATLKNLNAMLEENGLRLREANKALAESERVLTAQQTTAEQLRQQLATAATEHQAAMHAVTVKLQEVTQQVAAANRLATARRAALADVMQFAGQLSGKVAPLLAAE